MRQAAIGATLGIALACGVLLVLGWAARRRAPSLLARIGPWVGMPPPPPASPWIRVWRSGRPAGDPRRAASEPSHTLVPAEALPWACAGAAVGVAVALVLARGASLAVVALAVSGMAGGLGARSRWSRRAAARRAAAIEEQLPVAADLLAFAVSAGESPFAALVRVSALVGGPLGAELASTVADVRAGAPMEAALMGLAARTGSPTVGRFCDGLVLALERGSPVAESLRALASDARASASRQLVERAGRQEIAMLVPVVFVILPVLVAVAVYPGLQSLRLVVP